MKENTFFKESKKIFSVTPTILTYMTEELPFSNSDKPAIFTLLLPNRYRSLKYYDALKNINSIANDLIEDFSTIRVWEGIKLENILDYFREKKAKNVIIWGLGYRKEELLELFHQGKFNETIVEAGYFQQLENGTAPMIENRDYFNPNLMTPPFQPI